jgi:hypothetical protein
MDNLLETFCLVDDLCIQVDQCLDFLGHQLEKPSRGPQAALSKSEMIVILLSYHQSSYRNFKSFYEKHVCVHMRQEFPRLISYTRFISVEPTLVYHLWWVLKSLMGKPTGVAFIDSTKLEVCHIRRASGHKVFDGVAQKGKTSVGWFFGFKLHLCINECGELLSFWMTAGNEHDLSAVTKLTPGLVGKLFGDKGYISQKLTEELMEQGLQLVTRLRKNMKPKVMQACDAVMLRKRALIETVIDQLKNVSQVEHSRHRSHANFFINVLAALTAYCLQPKKPSLKVDLPDELFSLVAL